MDEAWGTGVWAFGEGSLPQGDVQELPPPIEGGTTQWMYVHDPGPDVWALGTWAGVTTRPAYPGGGIQIAPIPERGVMGVWCWWPHSDLLFVYRVGPDGVRTPVRGAYPLQVEGRTRTNLVLNPSGAGGLDGWLPDVGTPALEVPPDGEGVRAPAEYTYATSRPPLAADPVRSVTVSVDLRTSSVPSNAAIVVLRSTGATRIPVSEVDLRAMADGWTRVSGYAPTLGVVPVSGVRFEVDWPAEGDHWMDASRVVVEDGESDGTAFDGDSRGAQWLGEPQRSTSVLSPVQYFEDGECPFDDLVHYELYASSGTGRMVSQPAVLESRGNSWLTHPSAPGAPFQVVPQTVPVRVRAADQGVFQVPGRRRPVVVSGPFRRSLSGRIAFTCLSFAERDRLHAALEDLSPVLLRWPRDYGQGPGQWLSLGDTEETALLPSVQLEPRTVAADYVEVDPPGVA